METIPIESEETKELRKQVQELTRERDQLTSKRDELTVCFCLYHRTNNC